MWPVSCTRTRLYRLPHNAKPPPTRQGRRRLYPGVAARPRHPQVAWVGLPDFPISRKVGPAALLEFCPANPGVEEMKGHRYPLPRLAEPLRAHCDGELPVGFNYNRAYRLACDGKLPVVWIGNRMHIEERDVPQIAEIFGYRRTVSTDAN